jgi:polyisoprenoid-binding protein YceI
MKTCPKSLSALAVATLLASAAVPALAAPVKYDIDPNHTYPSFTADHFGGVSTWRGKFRKSTGTIVLDQQAQSGSVDVTIDAASIDLGHDKLNAHVKSPDFLDVAKFPTATYTGKLAKFRNGVPTEVEGALTLHGVTKPVNLKIDSFACKTNPMTKKDFCGANASAEINREDFGISYGKQMGFDMKTGLQIQVEAIKSGAGE